MRRTLDLYSPVSGYVTQKMAIHGMRVTSADTLFDIADLSHLWVLADVYESDLPAVRVGMPAELGLSYLPGRTWRGSVTYIAPVVEEKTRTIKVRVEVDNADGQLKPEMFADVALHTALGQGLVVPESAVIKTGERTLVFVDRGDGGLEPREVQVGAKVAEGVEVLSGLAEGERVVTGANFLLDSESSLKAALAAMSPAPPTPAPPAGRARALSTEPPAARTHHDPVHHPLQREQPAAGAAGHGGGRRLRPLHPPAHPGGRDPRPLRHPGHRLLALGPQPRHHGGPGHVSRS